MRRQNYRLSAGLATLIMLFVVGMMMAVEPNQAKHRSPVIADEDLDYVPGELIVKFKEGAPPGLRIAALRAAGAHKVKGFRTISAEHWRVGPGMSTERALKLLSSPAFADRIEYAEPNFLYRAADFPSDTFRGELWGMHNIGQTGGALGADIDALEAWQHITGSDQVIVGVIDSGIDYEHEDLSANMWVNLVESGGFAGVDDDGNGYVDDIRGWDFVNGDNDPMDDLGHGTHVAGTIGAAGNNALGVTGVSWDVQLMPLKFLDGRGYGTTDGAIAAVEYAAWFGVPVTNNSWGGGRNSKALENAIGASGALFVAAAGNGGSTRKFYPASFRLDNIISVAATDHDDLLAGFSNRSATLVDLGAPGVDVFSTVPGDGYATKTGTSMATPHVSGVAALLLAQDPTMHTLSLKDQILNTVDVIPSLVGNTVTGGRLNVARAVGAGELLPDSTPPDPITGLVAGAIDTTITLEWIATGDDGEVGSAYLYDVRFLPHVSVDDGNWEEAWFAFGEPPPGPMWTLETLVFENLTPNTTYHFAAKALDEAGNISAISGPAQDTTEGLPPSGPWEIEVVPADGIVGDFKLDPSGNPAIAYHAYPDLLRLLRWDGVQWKLEHETTGGSQAIGLAFNEGTEEIAISQSPGLSSSPDVLYCYRFDGTSWYLDVVDSKKCWYFAQVEYASNGTLAVGYTAQCGRHRTGLELAWWDGAVWDSEFVERGAGARHLSMAIDPNGNPAFAYSDDADHDNRLDTLKVAFWEGGDWPNTGQWAFEVVETGVVGYGVDISMAFDIDGNPWIAHCYNELRVLRRVGSEWERVGIGGPIARRWRSSIAFDQDWRPYVAFIDRHESGGLADVKVAIGTVPGEDLVWTIETIDETASQGSGVLMEVDPSGTPWVSYVGANWTGRLAHRTEP